MKKTKLSIALFGILACSLSYGQESQFKQCRAAEEALSDVSVYIAQGYNAVDLETSQGAIKQVRSQLDKGEVAAKDCACPEISRGIKKTKEILRVAGEENQLEDIQARFQEAIVTAEDSRFEAEKCWRNAAMAMKKSD